MHFGDKPNNILFCSILVKAWNFQRNRKTKELSIVHTFFVGYWKVCQNAQCLFACDARLRDICTFCHVKQQEMRRLEKRYTLCAHTIGLPK